MRKATTSLLPKKATTNPLPRMATGLGTTMSPLPQGQLAAYVMQDDDEPLAIKGLRAAYAVQGNDEPLATKSNWAMTFDNCKGATAPAIKLIESIPTPHHCHGAPKHLQ